MIRTLLLILLLPLFFHTQAQDKRFPKDYYTFPIKPGQQNYLSAKMGELRSNHFHGGLDIKTDGREGLNVYAVADGYVYRVKVSSYGYGLALYIQHPNGQKSVYAHLQKFDDKIAQYVLEQQYAKESFSVDLSPPVGKFKFKQGEVIALSGNSGSSFGAHLHFEIRTPNDEPLKVLNFCFDEIKDDIAPEIRKVAIRTKSTEARINGEYGRFEQKFTRTGKNYKIQQPIKAHGLVGIDLQAYDLANAVSNIYGIYQLTLNVNGKTEYFYQLDQYSYSETRKIHTFIDYEHKKTKSQSFLRCYSEDGNTLSFYPNQFQKDGKILVEDSKTYEVELILKDYNGNKSTLALTLVGDKSYQASGKKLSNSGKNYWLDENTLFFHSKSANKEQTAKLGLGYTEMPIVPSYQVGYNNAFAWDMRKGLPRWIKLDGKKKKMHYREMIPSKKSFYHKSGNFQISFPKNALYDTLYLALKANGNDFTVGDPTTPLFKAVRISFSPDSIPINKSKLRVYGVSKSGGLGYEGGSWKGNTITFSTRGLGDFRLKADTKEPSILLVKKSSKSITFRIRDSLSGIQEYRSTLNGKFLLMKYDHRISLISSKRLDETKPLKGKLRLEVTDRTGNLSVMEMDL
ncbi:MAG: hypothetical protein ACJAWV_003360 [Flammeovirgaceae bacterium]|jgi:hypothetical protein